MTFSICVETTIPVMAGYMFWNGFGMLQGAKGYGIIWALAMSVHLCGSMQYVANFDLIIGGAVADLSGTYGH